MRKTHRPGDAASYGARVERSVPGLRDMHRMVALLLAERVPTDGRVLVLGAGGGLELSAMAELAPGWRFDGIDPSAEMIGQARVRLGANASRVAFHEGYIEAAPDGPFDGATALLVLHFLPRSERLQTLRQIARRLAPGAPLAVLHHSFAQTGVTPDLWLRRNAQWLIRAGLHQEQAMAGIATMKERLPVLSPEDDEALLYEAGFGGIELFYAALTFRGWICHLRME